MRVKEMKTYSSVSFVSSVVEFGFAGVRIQT